MEETELEEGEACFDDNDASIDPDTALSYIGDRLQNLLGHFQKDFENEVSAETLGPKFGGYGSFLPSQKKVPVPTLHSHIKTPQTVQVSNKPSLQGPPLNSTRPPANSSFNVSKIEPTTSNSVNPRSLKVRIKVGCDKSARKNAALYSGLGLSSPSSSMGNDLEDRYDPSTKSHDIPLDSPGTILRDMTSAIVPGNRLLSPLNESLICLPKKERSIENKPTPPIMGRKFGIVDDSSSTLMEGDEASSQERSEMESMKGKASKGVPLSRKDLKVNLSFDSALFKQNQAVKKDVHVPVKKREPKNKEWITDHDVKHSSSAETKAKKLSLDAKTKGKTVHSVSKNDPDVEKKVSLKAMTLEPHEVKVAPQDITKLPLERKSKLTMKDKKSVQKDIVKLRNSYRDILDTTRDNDENTQRRELQMPPTGHCEGLVVKEKEKQIPINGVVAESADPLQIQAPPDNWVACDRCEKWRLLPVGIEPKDLPDKWLCSMSTWLPGRNSCDISEDETSRVIQEMNLQKMSHYQNPNHTLAADNNIRDSDHITNSEVMPKRLKKEGTPSHLSQKRKSSSETLVNKSNNNFLMGRHADKVNAKDVDEGDVKPKKLKSTTGYDHVNSGKIKTEAAPDTAGVYRDRLVISVKRQTETELSMKNKLLGTEIHAKKRKLKDWEESQQQQQPSQSSDRIGGKEKRLKTSDSAEIKDNDRCTLKGKTMKIILPGSKENSVDRKRKNSEHGTTSSSSKVSDSCRRVSLQERKGSPVGSVSSSPIMALKNLSSTIISKKSGERTQISRKLEDNTKGISAIDASQKSGGKVDLKHKESFKVVEDSAMKESLSKSKCSNSFQRVKVKGLTEQEPFPNKMRKVEGDVDRCRSSLDPEHSIDSDNNNNNNNKGVFVKKISKKRTGGSIIEDVKEKEKEKEKEKDDGAKLSDVKKGSKKLFVGELPKKRDSNEVEQKVEGSNLSNVNSGTNTMKDLGVVSFVKAYASSQTAMTALKRAEESKDYADRIKVSGFDYECNDAYFDSALKFLYAASLLEASSIDLKGVGDIVNAYTTSAKLSRNCGQEYEKRKEMGAASLAYKCMEVAYMRIVYCKSLLTRQDLQTSLQMVNQGESPSSSASDVDNLNNGGTMDKSVLSKSIAANPGNHLVPRNQANFLRLLDYTSDVELAMEASRNALNLYKAATSVEQESRNKEMTNSIKRVVEFSFQDVKEVVFLVQNAREAINRQGFKGNNNNKRE